MSLQNSSEEKSSGSDPNGERIKRILNKMAVENILDPTIELIKTEKIETKSIRSKHRDRVWKDSIL